MRRRDPALHEGLFQTTRKATCSFADVGVRQEVHNPASDEIAALQAADLVGRSDRDIAHAFIEALWRPPAITEGPLRGERGPGHDHLDRAAFAENPSVQTFWRSERIELSWRYSGNGSWLRWWPDATAQEPVGVELFGADPVLEGPDKAEWNRVKELAFNLFLPRPDESLIDSFVEIPRRDQSPSDVMAEVTAEVEARDRLLRGYVDAFARTAAELRPTVINELVETVARRRAELAWEQSVEEALTLYSKIEALEIKTAGANEPNPVGIKPLELPPRQLAEASFAAIVTQLLRWRDAVEQHPGGFSALSEEAITDVLAAAMTTVFGVAGRETFVRSGKADLVIPVQALRDLTSAPVDDNEPPVFVAEAKKGTGAKLAEQAAEQVERYRTERTRQVVLLFYVTAKGLRSAVEKTLDQFRASIHWQTVAAQPGDGEFVARFDHVKGGSPRIVTIFIHAA